MDPVTSIGFLAPDDDIPEDLGSNKCASEVNEGFEDISIDYGCCPEKSPDEANNKYKGWNVDRRWFVQDECGQEDDFTQVVEREDEVLCLTRSRSYVSRVVEPASSRSMSASRQMCSTLMTGVIPLLVAVSALPIQETSLVAGETSNESSSRKIVFVMRFLENIPSSLALLTSARCLLLSPHTIVHPCCHCSHTESAVLRDRFSRTRLAFSTKMGPMWLQMTA